MNSEPAADFSLIVLVEASRSARVMASQVLADLERFNSQVRKTQELASELSRRSSLVRAARPAGAVPNARTAPQVSADDKLRLESLTAREREVLTLIGEGKRTKEIAYVLGISVKTAVTHRSHLMDKLAIHEGPSLVRFAIRTGLCGA